VRSPLVELLSQEFVLPVLVTAVMLATPLLLAALGETLSEKSGVFNIGIEGYMLMGAFAAYAGALVTRNLWSGCLIGIVSGLALALLHSILCVTLGSDQIVSGIGINVFSWGITSFIFRMLQATIGKAPMGLGTFKPLSVPILSDIPWLGPAFFEQSILTYLSYILIFIFGAILYRTQFGLKVRAAGEDPLVTESRGVNPIKIRYVSVLICGAIAGLAGSFYTLVWLSAFNEGMTAGRGFIVLGTVIVSGWNPYFTFGVCLIFAFVEALGLKLQIFYPQIPYPFMLMLPYVITIIVLALRRRVVPPKNLGVPYKRAR